MFSRDKSIQCATIRISHKQFFVKNFAAVELDLKNAKRMFLLIKNYKGSVTYRFCPRETSYGRWGMGRGGGGVSACDVSRSKIVENFDSLFKIFNVLKSSSIDLMHKSRSGPCILGNRNLRIVIGHPLRRVTNNNA